MADSILVPRAWSCASTPRAAGCPWRPSTVQPSRYGDGDGGPLWAPLGGKDVREDIPGLWTLCVLDHHLSPSPQALETHLALCSASSRKLIQKYFSNRIQQQVGVSMVLPAPSHIAPVLTGPACRNEEFPHHPPSPGAVGADFATALSRRGLNASQRIPAHPGTPKLLLSLCHTLCIPSIMGMKNSILIPVPPCPAGHQLREVWGRDHQSPVPAFGAETPCGSAQRHQPHPTGLQRWVWVGRAATLPQGPLSLVPGVPQLGERLAVLRLSVDLLFYPRRWIWGKRGVIVLVLGGSMGCGMQDHAGHSAHIPLFVAQASSQCRRLFFIVQSSRR